MEIENTQLKNLENNKEKDTNNNDANLLLIENGKLKNENSNLIEKLEKIENNAKQKIKEKEEELNKLNQEIQNYSQKKGFQFLQEILLL